LVAAPYRLNFGEGMDFLGTYVEAMPYSRIVWTNEEASENGSVTTVTFEEDGDKTLLVMSEVFASKEAFDAGAGAEDATHETFARLDDRGIVALEPQQWRQSGDERHEHRAR
jgi:uncharacterized protein YndB with AHSA1/START domain